MSIENKNKEEGNHESDPSFVVSNLVAPCWYCWENEKKDPFGNYCSSSCEVHDNLF